MEPYQERVVEEKTELDNKRAKLLAFFETDLFKNLDREEQSRMARQWTAMTVYSNILRERIAKF